MNLARRFSRAVVPRLRMDSSTYEGASGGRRMVNWNASRLGPNSIIFKDGDILRARSRDAARKNPWASKAIAEWVSNAIGTGITAQSRHPDKGTRGQIDQLFARWCDECDSTNQLDFYGLQALTCRSTIEGGESLVRRRGRLPQDGLSVPLQYQILEAEHLPPWGWSTTGAQTGNIIRGGIEFDQIGRRVAYHLYKQHPGDAAIWVGQGLETSRVPADQVFHIYEMLRPGQVRGVPRLATALVKLYDLDQYDDAELQRKKNAAMFVGFYTQPQPEDQAFQASTAVIPSGSEQAGVAYSDLEPGTMQALRPGEEVRFSEPPDVGGMFMEFERQFLRAIAAAIGVTYELMTGDLTGVNYSSIRAGLLAFRRACEQFQFHVMVFQMCRPTWRDWIKTAIISGALGSQHQLAFAKDPTPYYAVEWHTPRWEWVDPLKDSLAERNAIRSGLKARSISIKEQGYDPEEMDRLIKEDNDRADKNGFVFDTDPRRTSSNGLATDDRTGHGLLDEQQQAGGQPQTGVNVTQAALNAEDIIMLRNLQ